MNRPPTNIERFKLRAAVYWTNFNPEDFPNTSPTTPQQRTELRLHYKDTYGKAGSRIVNTLSASEKLNGGKTPSRHYHFPGITYAMPVSLYFMRRATGWNADDAYKIFAHDVHAVAKFENTQNAKVPTPQHLEQLCAPELHRIARIDAIARHITSVCTAFNTLTNLLRFPKPDNPDHEP